ncbi:hypothetical protein SMICM304S_07608 [Streptomyces microflavus]
MRGDVQIERTGHVRRPGARVAVGVDPFHEVGVGEFHRRDSLLDPGYPEVLGDQLTYLRAVTAWTELVPPIQVTAPDQYLRLPELPCGPLVSQRFRAWQYGVDGREEVSDEFVELAPQRRVHEPREQVLTPGLVGEQGSVHTEERADLLVQIGQQNVGGDVRLEQQPFTSGLSSAGVVGSHAGLFVRAIAQGPVKVIHRNVVVAEHLAQVFLVVGGEGTCQFGTDADEVDDLPPFLRSPGAVGARHGLEETRSLHGTVEVEDLLDGGVEAGEKHGLDDEEGHGRLLALGVLRRLPLALPVLLPLGRLVPDLAVRCGGPPPRRDRAVRVDNPGRIIGSGQRIPDAVSEPRDVRVLVGLRGPAPPFLRILGLSWLGLGDHHCRVEGGEDVPVRQQVEQLTLFVRGMQRGERIV